MMDMPSFRMVSVSDLDVGRGGTSSVSSTPGRFLRHESEVMTESSSVSQRQVSERQLRSEDIDVWKGGLVMEERSMPGTAHDWVGRNSATMMTDGDGRQG